MQYCHTGENLEEKTEKKCQLYSVHPDNPSSIIFCVSVCASYSENWDIYPGKVDLILLHFYCITFMTTVFINIILF